MPEYKFIPKNESIVPKYGKNPRGFFWFSFFVFIAAVLISAGFFLYEGYLKKQIDVYVSSFEKMKSRIEPSSLSSLIATAGRIESAKKILAEHKSPSVLFEFLERDTIKNNFYSSFSLAAEESREKSGVFRNRLTLRGVSKSYTDLAKQMNIFKSISYFNDINFSGFQLLEDGSVAYDINLTVEESLFKQ